MAVTWVHFRPSYRQVVLAHRCPCIQLGILVYKLLSWTKYPHTSYKSIPRHSWSMVCVIFHLIYQIKKIILLRIWGNLDIVRPCLSVRTCIATLKDQGETRRESTNKKKTLKGQINFLMYIYMGCLTRFSIGCVRRSFKKLGWDYRRYHLLESSSWRRPESCENNVLPLSHKQTRFYYPSADKKNCQHVRGWYKYSYPDPLFRLERPHVRYRNKEPFFRRWNPHACQESMTCIIRPWIWRVNNMMIHVITILQGMEIYPASLGTG